MKYKLILIALFSVQLSNCATITRGSSESFVITTDPTGADVSLSNGLSCISPCSLKVKRRPGFVVTVEKEGYKPVNTSVSSDIPTSGGAALAGNILLGGIIGAGVDAATGAGSELSPNPLHVILESE